MFRKQISENNRIIMSVVIIMCDSSALQMGLRQTTDERLQTRKKLLLESGCKEIIIMRL